MWTASPRRVAGRRRWLLAVPVVASILAGLGGAVLNAGCGANAAASAVPDTTPSSPPAWLLANAQRVAAQWSDSPPQHAYWGLLHDPELGRLTSSGPDDPSHHAYVIVLVGDYSKIRATEKHDAPLPGTTPSPEPSVRWILFTYASPSGGVGTSGFGWQNSTPRSFQACRSSSPEGSASNKGVQTHRLIMIALWDSGRSPAGWKRQHRTSAS
jgi:hypothetical protein